jgi:DNA-3-methyladenine glycosylase I
MLFHPYCSYVAGLSEENDVDKIYHDNHYGVRIEDDNELLCRFVMEINQAGLSWKTILNKEQGFRKAYHHFDVRKVARYNEKDIAQLMNDTGIIRNKLKINAAIYNAQKIVELQKEFGSLRKWLDISGKEIGQDKVLWLKLFKKHFKFVGGEIVGEFLMSIDMLSGSHDKQCVIHKNRSRIK